MSIVEFNKFNIVYGVVYGLVYYKGFVQQCQNLKGLSLMFKLFLAEITSLEIESETAKPFYCQLL